MFFAYSSSMVLLGLTALSFALWPVSSLLVFHILFAFENALRCWSFASACGRKNPKDASVVSLGIVVLALSLFLGISYTFEVGIAGLALTLLALSALSVITAVCFYQESMPKNKGGALNLSDTSLLR